MKIYFEDLNENVQELMRDTVRDDVILDKTLDIEAGLKGEPIEEDERRTLIDDKISEYENSDDLEKDIDKYINKNDKGCDYYI